MNFREIPTIDLTPTQSARIGDILPRLGVNPEAWSDVYDLYLTQLFLQHEEELHPNVPARTLSGEEFLKLLILTARLGARAGIAAIDTLRPPEPPF